MKENMLELKTKFDKIAEKGWIKTAYRGSGGGGLTFEKMIGKPVDQSDLPDYQGIEIKTHRNRSSYSITLFHSTPDGEGQFEMKRLAESYGYPDMNYRSSHNLSGILTARERRTIGKYYQYQLELDYIKKRVYLCIYRRNYLVERRVYWSFEWLKTRLYRKLKYLAFIDVNYKRVRGDDYYQYKNITFYELKGFDQFILLLAKGFIEVRITIDTFQTGKRKGQMHDHGTEFSLGKEHISQLFNELDLT